MHRSKKLGELIRTNRLNQGMTQNDLAKRAGTSSTSVSRIEKDALDTSYSTLKKVIESGLGGELELEIKF